MVSWVLKYHPNFDKYVACFSCGGFLGFWRYIMNHEFRHEINHLFFDFLYVVNCVRIDGMQYHCNCGALVGESENSVVLFNHYLIYEPIDTEHHDGLVNELDIRLGPDDDPDFVMGCAECHRPIGYGLNFLTRVVRVLDLVNVFYVDDVPRDQLYFMEEGLRIGCRCGAYLGYLNSFDRVVLGAIVSLGYRYRQ